MSEEPGNHGAHGNHMRLSMRLRQDPVLLITVMIMALGILIAVGLLVWWTFLLTPYYPTHPCAPDAKAAAAWIILR